MPGRRLAIFVDGCFWHGCPEHGRKNEFRGPNAELWREKMLLNAERDRRSSVLAENLGWHVVRVWECQVKGDAEAAASRVMAENRE